MLPWIITILIACSGRDGGDGESQPYDPNDQDSDVETDTDTAEDTDTDTDSGEDTDSGQDTDSGGDTDSGVPRGWTVLGGAMIVGSGLYIWWMSLRERTANPAASQA